MNRRTGPNRRGSTGGGRGAPASVLLTLAWALDRLVRFASWAGGSSSSREAADDTRPEKSVPPESEAPEPSRHPDETEANEEAARGPDPVPRGRRLATSLVFATLFFAGAALSAVAGEMIASPPAGEPPATADCGDAAAEPADAEAGQAIPAEECETGETETNEPAEGEESEQTPEGEPSSGEEGSDPPPAAETEVPADGQAPGDDAGGPPTTPAPPAPSAPASGATKGGHDNDAPPLMDVAIPAAPRALDPEAHGGGAIVWLHRVQPDPTPPARRLAPAFARQLRVTAARHRISWSLLLAVVRAQGNTGRVPIGARALDRTAARLAAAREGFATYRPWYVALRYAGRTAFADRALALDRYNRAVGLRALVSGLAAAKPSLERRVLADPKIAIYSAGRADVAAGHTDVRVLVLLRYLRIAHGSVTVSSLTSGHRLYARPGVVSAHVYGLAVDIAALGGRSIAGNQEPGGLTERAVRNLLLLPAELAPRQVISLLGLGGASFPLADHADHIHVGF